MELTSKLSISFFDLSFLGVLCYAKDLIKVLVEPVLRCHLAIFLQEPKLRPLLGESGDLPADNRPQ